MSYTMIVVLFYASICSLVALSSMYTLYRGMVRGDILVGEGLSHSDAFDSRFEYLTNYFGYSFIGKMFSILYLFVLCTVYSLTWVFKPYYSFRIVIKCMFNCFEKIKF